MRVESCTNLVPGEFADQSTERALPGVFPEVEKHGRILMQPFRFLLPHTLFSSKLFFGDLLAD
jgi:hypothetical protein